MFLSFALLSVIWSDSPFVTFKRWFRDLGNYLMILSPCHGSFPLEALRAVLRRLCFLLIPLSVVLVKYYPAIGKRRTLGPASLILGCHNAARTCLASCA